MILRISGTYIPNDLSRIIEYLFILASCSGNFPFPESIERSGLPISLSASANQNVIINVARENSEDRTPCSPHKPMHKIGRNNNNNRGHFYIPASPRRVSTKRFTRSTKRYIVKTRKRIKYIVMILYSSQYCIQIVWNLFRKQQQTNKQNKTKTKTKKKTPPPPPPKKRSQNQQSCILIHGIGDIN